MQARHSEFQIAIISENCSESASSKKLLESVDLHIKFWNSTLKCQGMSEQLGIICKHFEDFLISHGNRGIGGTYSTPWY